MTDPRYLTLVKILDGIRKDAPQTEDFRRFHSKNFDDIAFSRGQAFIHLYLLVKFGIESFEDRHKLICDGQNDGGLDAYYISEPQGVVYLIQSKFKNTDSNFSNEAFSASDLIKMEIERVLHGELVDSNGVEYNGKIKEFQLKYNQVSRLQVFRVKVIFLANIRNFNDSQIRKITSNLDYEIFDFEKSYMNLVKAVCSGTYYDPEKIIIELDLSDKSIPQLKQTVKTSFGDCEVTAVFVPTSEIGRIMTQYKNAILHHNPRNYLGLSNNPVNKEIRRSISSKEFNDFSLLNNGITILADEQGFSTTTGMKNVAYLKLVNPQIINGGQTAYTLSDIYQNEYKTNHLIFDGKEVLVRIVVLKDSSSGNAEKRFQFIQSISTSTNQQTQVKEADRHSSNPVLIKIQNEIYRKYGYLIELKKGEYYFGILKGYINKEFIIDRTILLRSFLAFSGEPTPARRHSETQLFEYSFIVEILTNSRSVDISKLATEFYCAYKTHKKLLLIEKIDGSKSLRYGYALRYGKYAVVYALSLFICKKYQSNLYKIKRDEIDRTIDEQIPIILGKWKIFEDVIQVKPQNVSYFDPIEHLTDFDTYYKGTTLKDDIKMYFEPS